MLITDIINILGNEFSSIYCVNRQDQYIQIYRHLNENTELDELMNEKKTYETVIQKYIETNVFEEDRNKMLVATDFNNICKQLQLVSQFTIHYRIKNNNLIERLTGVPDEKRTARFVCAIAAAFPDGTLKTTEGVIAVRIGYEERGENGFGYDPIFYLPEYQCYSAELSLEEKNKLSHRGKALRLMKERLHESFNCQ